MYKNDCFISFIRFAFYIILSDIFTTLKTFIMADEDTPQCKVEYIDLPDGATEETNWIKRAGKCKVTYVNGHTFEGM